ncbi:MAG: M20 family metallopeptidase [Alphaproteobacteria bacterium]|nr:M20 family metallopeptidase [Alphaproteobacteria bacterium]
MPIINRISAYADDLTAWRRHLHQHPELGFECHETAAFVAERLREFGVDEIHEGIATSGVVAVINGKGDGPVIGLRADMDALPMQEMTGLEHASRHADKMHACGHDGHTVMLLGAARYLAETRNFAGKVALIFQPAEEEGGGGGVMCDEGVMERFDIAQVYALHTVPDLEFGSFATNSGYLMAAVDDFDIVITGDGGHGAYPHQTSDPVAAALQLGQAIQTIVSRNVPALDHVVVSLTSIQTGTAHNIIPAGAELGGTVRTFRGEMRDRMQTRLQEICDGVAAAMNVNVRLKYQRNYPATKNSPEQADFAAGVAREIAGTDRVSTDAQPEMGAEDFAYMLERRPGAYLFLGQGDGPHLHHPTFDFNDDVAPVGASFFATLVERAQPVA